MGKLSFKSIFFSIFIFISLHGNIFAKNIVICIDGTGDTNGTAKDANNTNVVHFAQALVNDDKQIVKYFSGVATSKWKFVNKKGEYTGFGAKGIRNDADKFLKEVYKTDDKIYIFGFSRGAAIARDLVNNIDNKTVRLLGLWDTVAAFGIPIDILGFPFGRINIGKKLDIPSTVEQVYHLVSIDENRSAYIPTLIENTNHVEEVWFTGVHADVGGGFGERRLADITLNFMITRATKHGLMFKEASLASIPLNEKGEGTIHYKDAKELQLRKIFVRENDTNTSKKPKIHKSVFERMKYDETYKPDNVLSLDGAYVIVK